MSFTLKTITIANQEMENQWNKNDNKECQIEMRGFAGKKHDI